MVDLGEISGKCPDLLVWVVVLGRSGVLPGPGMGRSWYEEVLGELEVKVEGVVGGLRYFEIALVSQAQGYICWHRSLLPWECTLLETFSRLADDRTCINLLKNAVGRLVTAFHLLFGRNLTP